MVNNVETVKVVALIRQMCPAQKVDDMTADVWQPLLEEVRMPDCREALINLGRTEKFIGPSDIIREVKRIRSARVAAGPGFDPRAYPEATGDAAEFEAMRDHVRRLADGEPVREVPPAPERQRDMQALLAPLAERTRIDRDEDAEEGL